MQTEYDNEREIDLLDLFWEMLIQWKPMILCGLAAALIAVLIVQIRDAHTYAKEVPGVDDEISRYSSELTEAQRIAVESTMFDRDMLHEAQGKLDAIYEKGLDKDRIDYLEMRYSVSTDGIPVRSVCGLYDEKVSADAMREMINSLDNRYDDVLDQLIPMVSMSYSDAEDSDFGVFVISVPMLDGVSSRVIADEISPYIEIRSYDEINGYIPHQLSHMYDSEVSSPYTIPPASSGLDEFRSREIREEYNTNGTTTTTTTTLSGMLLAYRKEVMAYKNSIATKEAAFNDGQKNLYKYLLMKEEGTGASYGSAVSGLFEADSKSPYFSLLIGFIIGCIVYAVIMVIAYMLNGRVRTIGEISDCYCIRGLDEMHGRRIDTIRKKFLYSRRVYRFRYRKESTNIQEHVSETARHAEELARHNGLRRVTLLPAYSSEADSEGLCSDYEKALKKDWNGDQVPMIAVGSRTLTDIIEDPGDNEGLILLLKSGDTTFKMINSIMEYCRDYSVNIVGAVLLED